MRFITSGVAMYVHFFLQNYGPENNRHRPTEIATGLGIPSFSLLPLIQLFVLIYPNLGFHLTELFKQGGAFYLTGCSGQHHLLTVQKEGKERAKRLAQGYTAGLCMGSEPCCESARSVL